MADGSWIWVALLIFFGIIEGLTVGLISIWFAVGAVAALIVSAFTSSPVIQIGVFLVVSLLSLAVTRPIIIKNRLDKHVPTNADLNVGKKGMVIAKITPDVRGRVRLDGVDWSATSLEVIEENCLCVVEKVDGATLTVSKESSVQSV